MWIWIVKFVMGLLRWFIINYIAKPLVELAIIQPMSEMLLGEAPVGGVLEDAIEADVELGEAPMDGVLEDAVEADAERVANDIV